MSVYIEGISPNIPNRNGFIFALIGSPGSGKSSLLLNLFRSKNCVGVCVLDRFITEPLKSRVYKKVVVFPEISNVSIQKKESVYSKQIKEMAKSRVVVGLLGVEQNEGITALIRLIKKVDIDKYFFVFAGKLDFKIMDEKQRQEVELFMKDQFE
jgi:ABC-type cobalamin/Fe3+-siderophores transport system ATPase subunit